MLKTYLPDILGYRGVFLFKNAVFK